MDYTNSEEFNDAQLAETNRALDVLCVMNSPLSSMISRKEMQFAIRTIALSGSAVNGCRHNWSVDDDITTVAIFFKQLAVTTVGDNPKTT